MIVYLKRDNKEHQEMAAVQIKKTLDDMSIYYTYYGQVSIFGHGKFIGFGREAVR